MELGGIPLPISAPVGLFSRAKERNVKLHETLDKAADVMTERGLAKGNFKAPDGSVCLVGALIVVKEAIYWQQVTPELGFLERFFRSTKPEKVSSLRHPAVRWNDHPETTEGEVIDFLREAAIAAKEASK